MTYIYEELNEGEVTRRLYADKQNNGFSYEGCRAIASWLLDYVNNSGENLELDVVALRCDLSEYEDLEEVIKEYSNSNIENLEDLMELTTVIEIPGTSRLIVRSF